MTPFYSIEDFLKIGLAIMLCFYCQNNIFEVLCVMLFGVCSGKKSMFGVRVSDFGGATLNEVKLSNTDAVQSHI
jgi:hypothetical protein